jgi:hypothetical protein
MVLTIQDLVRRACGKGSRCRIRQPLPPLEGLDDVDEVALCPGILVAGDPELLKRMGLLPFLDLSIRYPHRLQLPFRSVRGLIHRALSLQQLAAF